MFIIAIIEFVPIFMLLMLWIWIEDFLSSKKKGVYLRSPAHWESLNFFTRLAYNLCGIRIEVENTMDNDIHSNPCLFLSNHGSILDVMTLL